MEIIIVKPQNCKKWKYADRVPSEMGNLSLLAEDIKKNGQVEPVILRGIKDKNFKYEVIAGSRRWQACLQNEMELKAIVQDLDDEQAMIAQVKENEKMPLSDYSRGLFYSAVLEDGKTTRQNLMRLTRISKSNLDRFLCFKKVPQGIWTAVGNMTKISARSAETIYSISRKGDDHIGALFEIAVDLRKGAGNTTIRRMVDEVLNEEFMNEPKPNARLTTPDGRIIGTWTQNGINFAKDLSVNQDNLSKVLIKFFQKVY